MFVLRNLKVLLTNFPQQPRIFYDFARTKKTKTENVRQALKEVFFPPILNSGIRDKVALVTGGVDGIGLRCVRELLTGGAKGVMIADTDETTGYNKIVEISKDFGGDKVAFIRYNPSDYVLIKNAFLSAMNHFKTLDIVINNIRFRDCNWEDQIDDNIKGVVLSSQFCLEFMGRNNGGKGGTLLNIASNYNLHTESCPLHFAVQDFIIRFDKTMAKTHFQSSDIKVLTICEANFDSIGCDLATILTKGSNGCVWKPV